MYLKEVISEVAFLHRSGEYNGLRNLKANLKDGVGFDHWLAENVTDPLVDQK